MHNIHHKQEHVLVRRQRNHTPISHTHALASNGHMPNITHLTAVLKVLINNKFIVIQLVSHINEGRLPIHVPLLWGLQQC